MIKFSLTRTIRAPLIALVVLLSMQQLYAEGLTTRLDKKVVAKKISTRLESERLQSERAHELLQTERVTARPAPETEETKKRKEQRETTRTQKTKNVVATQQ